MKRLIIFAAIIMLTGVCMLFSVDRTVSSSSMLEKAAPALQNLLEGNDPLPEMIPVYIIMREQVDHESLYQTAKLMSRKERRAYTVEVLQDLSERTQADLRNLLFGLEDEDLVSGMRYLWISNLIGLNASYEALTILDKHPDIGMIEYDPPQQFLEELEDIERNRLLDERQGHSANTREITYNVLNVNAPEVWELGVTGEGVVVAVIDSGVNYNHHDIRNRMWTHPDFPRHGYNFYEDSFDPMDNEGHGTHCAGTIAGDGTSGSQTGIAPGAKIMALKPLHGFTGQHQTFWQAVQFAVEYEADVLSVSMYWRHTLIDAVTRATFRTIMVNTLSAGIVMCKSAGNDGNATQSYPVPYNVNIPAGSPPPWLHPDQVLRSGVSCVISVGATDAAERIAIWSSVGPATWINIPGWNDYHYNLAQDQHGLLKPDIIAPGVSVKSLIHSNDTGYTFKSGTSMAAPAVAGVIALMLSKNPYLSPELISQIIEETAVPYALTKTNVWGSGQIDALAAVNASSSISVVDLWISDDNNNLPEPGETVDISIRLKNIGVTDAAGLTGILSTQDDFIHIVNNEAIIGNIEPDSTLTIEEAFTVTIAENTPHNHRASFTLLVTDDEDRQWTSRVSFIVRGPLLVIDSLAILGNLPEYGKTVNLRIDLANEGESEASNVSARLASYSQYVTIIENQSTYPDIAPEQVRANNSHFTVAIAPDAPFGTRVIFSLTINSAGDQVWVENFQIDLLAPSLTLAPPFVHDPFPGGNGNGVIDPGEDLTIYFPIKNSGDATSPHVGLEITTESDLIDEYELTDIAAVPIRPGETVYSALRVRVSENAVNGSIFNFNYSITSGEYLLESNIALGVGGIIQIRLGEGNLSNPTSGPSPINIYYRSARTQTVYTAQEIQAQGFQSGGTIAAIGYYIVGAPAHRLNNFLVRMAHTDAVNASEHIEGPYATVFRGDYTPVRNTWDMLQFDTPFYWNGIDNILIDTAFPPVSGWSSTGQVLNYQVPYGFRFTRADSPDQTDILTNTANSDKPQIMINLDTATWAFLNRPRELDLTHRENGIRLNWLPPIEANRLQGGNSPEPTRNRRANSENARQNQESALYRNPLGYNIYRNGNKINTVLVAGTQYDDVLELTTDAQYYYVSAVYEEGESLPSNVISTGIVESTTFSHQQGNHFEPIELTLSSMTSNANIYYSFNEDDPLDEFIEYTEPLLITYLTNVRSFAVRESWKPSGVAAAEFHILYSPGNLRALVQEQDVSLTWDVPWSPDDDDYLRQGAVSRMSFAERSLQHRESLLNRRNSDFRDSHLTRDYILGYNIYRSAVQDSFIRLNEELLTAEEYLDEELEIGLYHYYVTSVYRVGESGTSRILQVGVGVADAEREDRPELANMLYNAYPNPFNPSTKIAFSNKEEGRVIIEVFDISGARIKVLVDHYYPAGKHHIVWEGKDSKGRQVSSGIYLFRMTASDYTASGKAVLLK